MSKEQFKEFVRKRPELSDYVKDNLMTWQQFYELYDLYGEDNKIWDKYTTTKRNIKVTEIIKKIDPDSIQKHIESAQKALDIFSEFATKTSDNINTNIKPAIERPISKFFGD